jgi:hypothetical protein
MIDGRMASSDEGGTMSRKGEFHNLDNPHDGLFRLPEGLAITRPLWYEAAKPPHLACGASVP